MLAGITTLINKLGVAPAERDDYLAWEVVAGKPTSLMLDQEIRNDTSSPI